MSNKLVQVICVSFVLFISTQLFSQQNSVELLKAEIQKTNKSISNVDFATVKTKEILSHGVLYHEYFMQQLNGIEIVNSFASIHKDKSGKVFHHNNQLIATKNKSTPSTVPQIPAAQILQKTAHHLNLASVNPPKQLHLSTAKNKAAVYRAPQLSQRDIPINLVYIQEDQTLKLAWEFNLYENSGEHWWHIIADAQSGTILQQNDWVVSCTHTTHSCKHKHNYTNKSTINFGNILKQTANNNKLNTGERYNVFPLPVESPYVGNRTIVNSPADPVASPYGWHDTDGSPGHEYTTTQGNNITAIEAGDNPGYQPDGGAFLNFDFPLNTTYSTADQSEDASLTNQFYWNNVIHDVLYHYGFDEESGNFQVNNYGNGGAEDDPVIAQGQDSEFSCNASMATPPDGTSPTMRIFLCGSQDAQLDNGVTVHEYGHGISNRLTGGPSKTSCLQNREQMGEGWSDFYALHFTWAGNITATTNRYIGNFLLGEGPTGNGVRYFPYTTDIVENPLTYDDITQSGSAHWIGEVWCTMLYELTWGLINEYGYDADLYHGTGGNNKALHLVTEAMKLQPCSPGFVNGRDAILAADQALYGAANHCIIWTAFAKRGLGMNAEQGDSNSRFDQVEDFTVPAGICQPIPGNCQPRLYATLPYENDFETGSLDKFWCTSSNNPNGSVQVNNSNGANSGSYALEFSANTSGTATTNEATIGLRTANIPNVNLSFYWKSYNDVYHPEDGLFISDDGGTTYTKIFDFDQVTTNFELVELNLTSLISINNLNQTDEVVLKFQQKGNQTIPGNGIAIDDLLIDNTSCELSVAQERYVVSYAASTELLEISTLGHWYITPGSPWVTPQQLDGFGDTNVSISIEATPENEDRYGYFILNCGNDKVFIILLQVGLPVPCNSTHASLPYFTGFESGTMDNHWCSQASKPSGRIRVLSDFEPYQGQQHLILDNSPSSQWTRTEATLLLDLLGETDVTLSFWWKGFEETYTGEEGVYFSDNGGVNYVRVFDFDHSPDSWAKRTLDLSGLATANNLSLSNQFVVKFQQADSYSVDGIYNKGGLAFDNILVESTTEFCITDEGSASLDNDSDFNVNGQTFTNPWFITDPAPLGATLSNQQLLIYFRTLGQSCEDEIEIRVTDPTGNIFTFDNLFGTSYCSVSKLHSAVIDLPQTQTNGTGTNWIVDFRDQYDQNPGDEYSVRYFKLSYNYAVINAPNDDCDGDGVINADDPAPLDPCINDQPTSDAITAVFDDDFFADGTGYNSNPSIDFDFPTGFGYASITNASLQLYFRVNPGSCQNDIDVRIYQPNGYSIDFPAAIGGTCNNNYPLYNITLPIPDLVVEPFSENWRIQFNDSDDQLPGDEFSVRAAVLRYNYELQNTAEEDCGDNLDNGSIANFQKDENQLRVSMIPNPAIDRITLEAVGALSIKQVAIFDVTGKEMIRTENTNIDISEIPAGMYLVHILLNEGRITTKRLVITD